MPDATGAADMAMRPGQIGHPCSNQTSKSFSLESSRVLLLPTTGFVAVSSVSELQPTPAITISVVRLPERRRQEMMVMAALRRLDALLLVR